MDVRLTLVAASLVALAAVALVYQPALAVQRAPLMCSADSTFDALAASDVIIAGRIDRYEVIDAPPPEPRGQFTPVALHLDVDRVLKGSVAPGERIVDVASLMLRPVEGGGVRAEWVGGAGACGAIDHEPAGWYAIFGLRREGDGTLQTHRLTTFYLREEPYTPETIATIYERLGLPAAGSGTGGGSDSRDAALVTLAAAGALLVAAGLRGVRRYRAPYQ